ncbi:uncharacterized protein F5891DRAFT_1200407 [Suillus fuscotomentosus]|uniref:CxC1-like cysteine cluster associated with KDZ transposases domain-containing protein n=1 Tax=Suillus fuscotomentosus TaxID=1912939 RepID=A0AAD4DQW5_9AGAM|nr:uncharacterized protein F5891DRAFT_1200407 [Suillus fuscotomentosus]KAG1886903.1 hypothetical protein F5891DRAFT_1200407 [Suillus fuscotomentosus]
MPPARHTRGTQPTSMGLGHHFVSPKKARDPKKTQTLVHIPGVNSKHQRLLDQMAALMQPQVSTTETPTSTESQAPMDIEHTTGNDYIAEEVAQPAQVVSCPTNVPKVDLGRRHLLPNKMANNLYNTWKVLIPTLVEPHLKYSTRTHGYALPEVHPVISACASHTSCTHRQFSIVCLFFDRFLSVDVLACRCSTLSQVLLYHGLFPTAPSQPHMAVSTDLLAFYRALFERSCDAIHALVHALKTHYARRGFLMTNADVIGLHTVPYTVDGRINTVYG